VLKNWVFSAASNALVFGTPFVVFFIIAHENISGHLTKRDDAMTMCRASIGNWPGFWQTVEGRRPKDKNEKETNLAAFLYSVANSQEYQLEGELKSEVEGVRPANDTRTHEIMIVRDRIDQADRETWFFERWINFVSFMIGNESSEFADGVADRRTRNRLRDMVIRRINTHCLSNSRLFEKFLDYKPDKNQTITTWFEPLNQLIATGQDLAKSLQDANREVSEKERDGWMAEGLALATMFDKHPAFDNSDTTEKKLGLALVTAIAKSRSNLINKKNAVKDNRWKDRTKALEQVAEARQELA